MRSDSTIAKTKTIGLVLDFFIPQILEGAHAYCEQHGLRLDARWSIRGDWTPRDPGWEGVIYGVVDDSKLANRIKRWKIPRVALVAGGQEQYTITPDYWKCGYIAARETIEHGATSLILPSVASQIDGSR